jgi:hypothetical protein
METLTDVVNVEGGPSHLSPAPPRPPSLPLAASAAGGGRASATVPRP